MLDEGTNEITLSLSNIWNRDINDITFVVDNEKLPEWLSIKNTDTAVDILKGERENKIIVIFDVENAPINALAEIPYSFKDSKGNIWSYTVNVAAHTDGSGMEAFDALYENYPNPFNPTTTIKYSLKENKHTKLVIYNSLGQVIRTLVHDVQDAGIHSVQWDGRDDNARHVSSGLYFYRLETGSFVKTQRMMLLE
ncbi:T9SS type A sorting domain-containing protein [Candidatus Latescibacterota bacterium]